MSKNTASLAKVQKMMRKMHIDDKLCTSSQLILPMVFENQSLQHCPQNQQQLQKQHCDRARFFYQVRQKKKQRRLQHGPLPIHHHQQQYTKQMKRNNQEQKKENKLITAIVGSSIARNISVKNIECENNEVRLRFKSGSDCADALAWLKSSDGQHFMLNVNQLLFILGTNDIHRAGAHETIRRIDHTIDAIRRLYPGIKIVWQLLQRRTRKTWLLPEGSEVLDEIRKCNIQLLQLASEKKFDTIQPNIPINEMCDGLHPTAYGVRMMETTIRNYLTQSKMVYSSSCSTDARHFQCDAPSVPLMSIKFFNI